MKFIKWIVQYLQTEFYFKVQFYKPLSTFPLHFAENAPLREKSFPPNYLGPNPQF